MSPGPTFVELVKVSEKKKMISLVPENEKDEGAVRLGSEAGWKEGKVPSAAGIGHRLLSLRML